MIGFDDIGISENYVPALTTMRQPREKIGRIATETLINILEGNVASSDPVRVRAAIGTDCPRQHGPAASMPATQADSGPGIG